MKIDLGQIVVQLGKKHSGKSCCMEDIMDSCNRFVALDPNHEHGPPGSKAVSTPKELLTEWSMGHTRLVVRDESGALTKDRAVEYMKAFGQLQDAYLFIDEAHNYMSYSSCPDVLTQIAKWHVSHNNCSLVVGAHQAKSIFDTIWTNRDVLMVWCYGDHEDSKLAEASIPPDYKQKVHTLDPNEYRFLYHEAGTGGETRIAGPVPLPSHLS